MSDDARPLLPHTTARAPFDDVEADIILHTSDHVDFRVFRLILTLSSPFFQGMFTLPQPPDTSVRPGNTPNATSSDPSAGPSKPPSVEVPEDSATLDTLLRFLYPNTHAPPFRDLFHARNVAIAASKYVMSAALDTIADKIETQYVASYPLQVYLIACRMGWESVAKSAAKQCLDSGRMPDEYAIGEDLLHYPGAGVAYHRLETYRDACRRALAVKLDEMNLFDENDGSECEDESENADRGISAYCLHRWAARYLGNIKQAMWRCPRKEKLDDFTLAPERNCGQCSIYLASDIATARLQVASGIDDVFSEVELRFGP